MKVRKQTRFAGVIGALFAASLTSAAIAGGTPAGAPSGATISGSSSFPSASMGIFSGSLTSPTDSQSGAVSAAGFSGSSAPVSILIPTSISSLLVGLPPGTPLTLQSLTVTYSIIVGSGGSMTVSSK